MNDYIKRKDAISLLQGYIFEHGFYCDTDADKHYAAELVDSLLTSAPAADVVERKKGKWVYDHWCEFKCSNCGAWSTSKPYRARENFCPNCGADMRNPTYTLSTESGTFSFRNTTQPNDSNTLEKDGEP